MKKHLPIIVTMLMLALFSNCKKEQKNNSIYPVVSTDEVTEIGIHSAMCSGTVTEHGETFINVRGICWGINHNPTVSDDFINSDFYFAKDSDDGLGSYNVKIPGLAANTQYYARAYATNSNGTAYGNEVSFTTQSYGSIVPEGGVNALFSINGNGGKVWFSKGNLQYQASTGTWRFAENQWDICDANTSEHNTTDYAEGSSAWIDLFGWGTSGYAHGAICYQPWSISTNSSDYLAYGQSGCNLYDQSGEADWGYNAISNGENTENCGWRSLTDKEWNYLLFDRRNSNNLFGYGQVNDKKGLILLPDDWSLPQGITFKAGFSSWENSFSEKQWSKMETAGAVFLPAAGMRNGDFVYHVMSSGDYWTSKCLQNTGSQYGSYALYFGYEIVRPDYVVDRHSGLSVRLVFPED
ncbi:MAG: hypothetical protein KBT57_05715 [bacterium]|nr:hypothetical protein [Candidatus Limimorpha equi]